MKRQNLKSFNSDLLNFIGTSPTPFHAVVNLGAILSQAGFKQLEEGDKWNLKGGGRYWLSRNGSSLIAFVIPEQGAEVWLADGLPMAGAHTDSPCLKLKPQPVVWTEGCMQFGVEVYGSALLRTWFDRDLSLAGRVVLRAPKRGMCVKLIDFRSPLAIIPSLAIHLDRGERGGQALNRQQHLSPIVALEAGHKKQEAFSMRGLLCDQLRVQGVSCEPQDVLDFELALYDTQPPSLLGVDDEFISGARLDNLLSCFVAARALANSEARGGVLVCNDHEEVGSVSAHGARGPMLESALTRLLPDFEQRARVLSKSLFISLDNAHGVHPNFSMKHDAALRPRLNGGPVIKFNANQNYASDSMTAARFRMLCQEEHIPIQEFVMRNDMPCGSTIGPLTAAKIGAPTLDVGAPTWAMHSIRETAGSKDAHSLCLLMQRWFKHGLAAN